MSSLVYINFPEGKSTLTSPFRFFTEMVNANPIQLAIQSFQKKLPNPYEGNFFSQFPHNVAVDRLSFSIERNVENVYYDDENETYSQGPSDEWECITYTFREELEKFLRSEYRSSRTLLSDKWEVKGFNKDSKGWFKNEITQLLRCITVIESRGELADYKKELVRPYEALIKVMYQAYPSYTPGQTLHERIPEILSHSNNSDLIYAPSTLSTRVYRKIAELTDKNTESVFGFTNPEETIKKMGLFGAKEYDEIKETIEFNKNIEAAYYVIRRLMDTLDIRITEIEARSIFTFKGKPFTSNSSYKNVHKFRMSNSPLRTLIDFTIDSCLS